MLRRLKTGDDHVLLSYIFFCVVAKAEAIDYYPQKQRSKGSNFINYPDVEECTESANILRSTHGLQEQKKSEKNLKAASPRVMHVNK